MKDRMSISPWPALRDQRNPSAGTSHTMFANPVGESANPVELSDTWRAWEAGTSSEFLNWFLFTPDGRSSTAETGILESWICFKEGSSELNGRAKTVLDERLKLLRANPAIRIVIGGLAGGPGAIDLGIRLGLRRVQSIWTFLLAGGIDPGRIGVAVRGSGWSVVERSGGSEDPTSQGSECRFQLTDPLWALARN